MINKFRKTELGTIQAYYTQGGLIVAVEEAELKITPQGLNAKSGRFGHIAYNCFHRYNEQQPPPTLTTTIQNNYMTPNAPPFSFHQPQAYLATPATITYSWLPHTGASHHITQDPHNLIQSLDYQGSDQIVVGEMSSLLVVAVKSLTSYKLPPWLKEFNTYSLKKILMEKRSWVT
ncbi:hypothetical protein PIB30_029434 [Stylosanthes scabra]|uniref:Uncharacterized protein n=1 Tax=Stylosanthes scabra TaxID=79078 RepID=A0ABU6X9E0_9FABA|nr:hypothetical protein [Stylosanthes scabra]